MNTRRVNSAADVIQKALQQNRTAAGIATALETEGLLMSPEAAADIASVSTDAVSLLEQAVAELKREHEENARLRARVAELEAVPAVAGPVPVVPAAEDVTPQVQRLRALLAGQREAVDGEHYPTVHHSYRVPRDLPRLGDSA